MSILMCVRRESREECAEESREEMEGNHVAEKETSLMFGEHVQGFLHSCRQKHIAGSECYPDIMVQYE